MYGVPQQFNAMPPQYAGMPQQQAMPGGFAPQQFRGQAPQQFAPAPMTQQYAPPMQQRYAAPAPQQQFGAPIQYGAPAPQRYVPPQAGMQPSPASYTPPPVMLPQVQPQGSASYSPPPQMPVIQQVAPMQPQVYNAPPAPAQQQPVGNSYIPQGGEMLQVTIFGTKGLPGANTPTVTIEVPDKHKGTIETQAITSASMVPKSLVTYIQPGEGLILIISEADQVLGAVELVSEDFYPNGVDGDLPLTNPNTGVQAGHLYAKIMPLGASGQMAELAPVVVPGEVQQQTAPAPVYQSAADPTVVPGTLRECTPEEFARLSAIPGAPAAQPVMPEQMQQYAQSSQPQQYVQQAPQYAQQPPQQYSQPPQQFVQQQPQQYAGQPQGRPVYGGGPMYR